MIGEAIAGLGAIKTAFDIAKGLKDIDDATRRNAAVIELQEKILAAQAAQSSLLEQIRELENEVADLKAWGTDKQNYELKSVHPGAFAYALKQSVQTTEPPHWICATCYQNQKKSILQYFGRAPGDNRTALYKCQRSECGAFIRVHYTKGPSDSGSD
jgi:uncharacterized coiled-coil DUF342 family protein